MTLLAKLRSHLKKYPDRGWMGRGTYGTPEIINYGHKTKPQIGQFCSIADKVTIDLEGEHPKESLTTYPFHVFLDLLGDFPTNKGPVVVGSDVWLCRDCHILSGVSIGDGAVIGAHTVVSKDVPAYAVVVGNPQRIVRYRYNETDIQRLLKLRWWDQEVEVIAELAPYLMTGDLDKVEEIINGVQVYG